MNPNSYEVFLYMLLHLFLFLFKDLLLKLMNYIYNRNKSKNDQNELIQMKKQLNSLNEQLKEISPSSEYAKYTKIERQIHKLNSQIIQKEEDIKLKNKKVNISNNPLEGKKIISNIYSFINSISSKVLLFIVYIIEYFILKNKYLEVDYNNNKTNIVVNHYYNENDNKYYTLIPVYRILICETLVLNSIQNIIQKLKSYLIQN